MRPAKNKLEGACVGGTAVSTMGQPGYDMAEMLVTSAFHPKIFKSKKT
jgi:hypothetical protein